MERSCPSCGASNYESARYCRKCGMQLGTDPFNEAPTRSFEEKRDRGTAPAPGVPEPGAPYVEGPQYTPPGAHPGPSGPVFQQAATGYPVRANTAPMQGKQKRFPWGLVIAGIVLALLLGGGLVAALIVQQIKHRIADAQPKAPQTEPVGTAPKKGSGGGEAVGGSLNPDKLPPKMKELYYPDSDIRSLVQMPSGVGSVMEMRTDDDAEDVTAWYDDKIGGKEGIQKVIKPEHTVFIDHGTIVNIEPQDGGVKIAVVFGPPVDIPPPPGVPSGVPGGVPKGVKPPSPPAAPPPPPPGA